MNIRKRKSVEDDQIFQTLEGQIKRVRITYTPGEIRLSKDVQEVSRYADVCVRLTELPSIAMITFTDCELLQLPCRFLVTVPRFYPHNAPVVQCLDRNLTALSVSFDENGQLVHKVLNEWKAVHSLVTILNCLREIRDQYKFIMKSENLLDTEIIGVQRTFEEDLSSRMDEEI